MYCQHCDRKHEPDAVFCSQCGKRLAIAERANETSLEEQARQQLNTGMTQSGAAIEADVSVRTKAGRKPVMIGLIPVFIFILTATAVCSYFLYETKRNEQVNQWHEAAKQDALLGKYEEALHRLKEASKLRPKYASLAADTVVVEEAIAFQHSIDDISSRMSRNELTDAEPLLNQLKQQLRGREEQAFTVIREQLSELIVRMTVGQIERDLDSLQTVEALATKLNQVKGLSGKEALSLQQQIEAKIVSISYKQAELQMKKKSFSDALATVQLGMNYAAENEQLATLYGRIQKEKQKFEQDEQKRIENAMQKAAEEDLINQTAAVEVLHVGTRRDENGDFHIDGQLKNAATRPIYSVSVEYTVHDSQGKKIESGKVDATPKYIEAGETFNFTAVVHGVEDEHAKVVIDHATWYLD
ncbi:FxLYD domain-containing protein [Paenibacillus radicis (ex Gao et al. 2016)]|uniref:Zinc-ribbon domain-containing protein n=1 Tax=Paenibacillus radicis (ex Gao et al. 2016) TaxID=1737354 RepID=A0A917HFZ4_9BACL|nr:FxLYD domain-containing protein [Paenibacillus radicis (ex Gao et al. 2016)]GGG77995.1 hypothetical protein GCM10010918_38510 [Paenibacillus radicis (ex Gao et al. 2016)]